MGIFFFGVKNEKRAIKDRPYGLLNGSFAFGERGFLDRRGRRSLQGFHITPLSSTDRLGAVGGGFFGRSKPLPYRGLGIFFGIFPFFCRDRRPRLSAPFVVTFSTNRLDSADDVFLREDDILTYGRETRSEWVRYAI